MKCSFEKMMKGMEWVSIPVGLAALILSFFSFDCVFLSVLHAILVILAGILCLSYIAYTAYLCIRMPKFDWHLMRGHFLFKVIAFVLLVPSLIACFLFAYSPENLVCEETGASAEDVGMVTAGDGNIVSKHKDPSICWAVYFHFIDPGNQHMTKGSGRGLSALIAILGVFLLNGLLISSIIGWIDSRKEKWLKGEIRYCRFLRRKKHYVIIGGNDMAFGIVQQIFNRTKPDLVMPYILIQTTRDVEEFRRELWSSLNEEQQQHVMIYYGSRTSSEDMDNLILEHALEVYVLGEQTRTDDLEPYHDTINMQCFSQIERIAAQNIHKWEECISCYVMFEYQTSFAAFQSSNQQRIIKAGNDKELLSFIPFSPYENWAQTVLVNGKIDISENATIKYNNIDSNGITYDSDKTVHLIVAGMSKMGVAMAIEAAHLAHFPNFVRDASKRTKITFIDKNAREESEFFMGRFPDLFKLSKWTDVDGKEHNWYGPSCDEYSYFGKNFIDIEWEFREGGVESKENRDYIESCFKEDSDEIVTIAICLPWPHQSLAAALYLPKVALHKANDIWVYQPQSGEMLIDINRKEGKDEHVWKQTVYRKLKPFGMLSLGFDAALLENDAVGYCSEFWKAKDVLVEQAKNKLEEENNGENACYWDYLNIQGVKSVVESKVEPSIGKLWEIWSNIYQINTIEFKYRSLGQDFSKLDAPDVKRIYAEVEHNRWNVEKLLMGFKPLEDHVLDTEEMETVKAYLDSRNIEAEISDGVNEKDIYYDWKEGCFRIKDVKKFYKDGPMKAHPNICPFKCLPMEDKDYDICFTLAMPFLMAKKIKADD